ncbi:MAG TPA: DNA internalization-related competence protein ComEC/Rec2 [Vicinamibacterales bacterium]|jgi:competence protein ComEC
MRAAAAIPAAGLLAGAAADLLLPDLPRPLLFAALILAGALSAWAWRRTKSHVIVIAAVGGFFAGGMLLSSTSWEGAWRPSLRVEFERLARVRRAEATTSGRRLPEDDEAFAVLEGTLRSDAAASSSGVSLSIDVDTLVDQNRVLNAGIGAGSAIRTAGGVLLTVIGSLAAGQIDTWRSGRRVRVPAELRRPSRYLDPGVPDTERALARRGTTLVGTVKSGALVELVARGGVIDEAMANGRARARVAIRGSVGRWSPQAAAIVAAIVIGDRAGLDPDVQRRLQEAGTYHVIAISGGNIAILAGLLIGAFRFAGRLGRGAMAASIVVLLGYAQFVGGGASVNRATLMAVMYFGARIFDQKSSPLNVLAVVAALLVAADPLSIADPAFLLTCGATLAILLVVPSVSAINAQLAAFGERRLRATAPAASRLVGGTIRQGATMFAASVATEALLFPVGAAVFSRVTFAGLGLNFLAIPLMAVAQIAGMAVVPIALVSARVADFVGWIAYVGATGLVTSADLVRFAPMLTYRIAKPPWSAIVVYYVAAAMLWTTAGHNGRSRRSVARAAAVLAATAALWILIDPRTMLRRGDGHLHVTFLDVGQGDSAFVVFPKGSTLLVDAGGLGFSSSFDIGDRVVAPLIRDAGFRRLDRLALTHGDPDHVGGALSILREFRPRQVWEGIPVPRSAALTTLRTTTESSRGRWANVYAGDHEWIDQVEVVARHPSPADWERQKVRNDDSLVLELRWHDLSVLLTGDIGAAVERSLVGRLPASPLRVIKVPHHGSATSSSAAFIEALHPQVAIISVGRSNHFGHPVPAVLDRYRDVSAAIFRTDQDGAVTLESDGHSVEIQSFNGRHISVRRSDHESTESRRLHE